MKPIEASASAEASEGYARGTLQQFDKKAVKNECVRTPTLMSKKLRLDQIKCGEEHNIAYGLDGRD
jgi:hypothetical protein